MHIKYYPFLFLFLLLVGCSSLPSTSDSEDISTQTIQHAMGTSEVPTHPQRVVVLTNEGIEALLSLGVKPVGAIEPWNGDPWYPHTAEQLEGVTLVGDESQPNIAKIASLKPDLIIGNKVRQEKVYEQLNKIAPTVFAEDLKGNWKINFNLYAKAVNKEPQAQQVLAEYQKKVEQVKQKAQEQLDKKISIVRFTAGEIRLYQKNSFSGVILDEIGFARPQLEQSEEDLMVVLTREQLTQIEGDVLFYFTYDTETDLGGSKLEQEITNDPLWKNLKPVQNQQVFKVSDTIWNTAGGILAAHEMIDQLSSKLDQFKK